jgi:hypothetical protein
VEYRATVRALRTTAERALAAHAEATQLGKELGTLARVVAPALLAQPGVASQVSPQVKADVVGLARLEPPPSSLPEMDGWALCYPAFALVVRLRTSYKDGVNCGPGLPTARL